MKRKMMNKLLAAAMTLAMICGLPACGGSSGNAGGASGGESSSSGNSSGETITITVANSLFAESPENVNLEIFKQTMADATDGRITVQIYPNSELGGDATNIESVQNGNVTMTFGATATMANYVPDLEMFDLPFVFESVDTAAVILSAPDFAASLDGYYRDKGFHMVGASIPGFRWMTSSKLIQSFDDMKGLKIRTMESPNHTTLWNALGCNATPMSGAELFTALQQGTVEGQENPISVIQNGNIYEVNSCLIDTRHVMTPTAWIVNAAWYDGLSEEDRALFDEAMAVCVAQTTTDNAEQETQQIEKLQEEGMTLVVPDDAWRASMKAAMGSSVEDLVRADIGNELVDALMSAVNR